MERLFVVVRSRGPAWDDSKPMESQTAVDGQRSPGYQADQSLATTPRHRRV